MPLLLDACKEYRGIRVRTLDVNNDGQNDEFYNIICDGERGKTQWLRFNINDDDNDGWTNASMEIKADTKDELTRYYLSAIAGDYKPKFDNRLLAFYAEQGGVSQFHIGDRIAAMSNGKRVEGRIYQFMIEVENKSGNIANLSAEIFAGGEQYWIPLSNDIAMLNPVTKLYSVADSIEALIKDDLAERKRIRDEMERTRTWHSRGELRAVEWKMKGKIAEKVDGMAIDDEYGRRLLRHILLERLEFEGINIPSLEEYKSVSGLLQKFRKEDKVVKGALATVEKSLGEQRSLDFHAGEEATKIAYDTIEPQIDGEIIKMGLKKWDADKLKGWLLYQLNLDAHLSSYVVASR